MFFALSSLLLAISLSTPVVGHAAMWHPSMYGFNQTVGNNRALDPLMDRHFNTSDPADTWWFHGHLGFPPHPEDIMQLPVGGKQMLEISCDKGVTSYWASAPGGNTFDPSQPDYPCPGQPTSQFHTTGQNDTGGCALAVAYKSNAWEVQPEDFVVFSVNQTCVWSMHTYFSIPGNMPPCPNGKCTCAFFWGHQADSGSEQIYMNGFQCNMAGAENTKPLPTGNPARRCGDDIYLDRPADPSNCTIGAKTPNYWLQLERNNQFEDQYHPPSYQKLYGFDDGAQLDLYDGIGAIQPSGSSPGIPATGTPVNAMRSVAITSGAAITSVLPSSTLPIGSATEKVAPTTKSVSAGTRVAPTNSVNIPAAPAPSTNATPVPASSSSNEKAATGVCSKGKKTTSDLHTTFTLVPGPQPVTAAPAALPAQPSASSGTQHNCKRGGVRRGPPHRVAAPRPGRMIKHRRAQRPSTF